MLSLIDNSTVAKEHTETDNLWLHLASWNLSDSQLRSESKTELSVAQPQSYFGGGHRTEKLYIGRGEIRIYLFNEGNNWGGYTHL